MTDKLDAAALVEWLQTWSPVTANGQRAHLAASELTRLAAENRTYAEAHAFNSARFAEMLSERDAAKAEIARLRTLLNDSNDKLGERIDAFLNPDTGEQLIAELHVSGTKEEWLAALAANREDALKPDTGE